MCCIEYTPHDLSIFLKRLRTLLDRGDHETLLMYFDSWRLPLDQRYFSKEDADVIHSGIEMIAYCLLLDCPKGAMDALTTMREYLDKIMVRNMILLGRFFKHDADIGTLNNLPELVLAQIYTEVYTAL